MPGGDTLTGRELGSRKARTLLALLAVERGALVPLDRIVEALWPDDAPADPAANVATLVSRTRKLLGADLLTATGRSYGLTPRGPWLVDLDEAARLTTESGARSAAGEPVLAAAAARAALTLLGTQPALVDEDDADWVLGVRHEADSLRRRARHLLAEALTALEPAEGARVAAVSVAADPYDEQAVRSLMRALVADGRAAAALAAYDDLAARLREDLGTDSGPRDRQTCTSRCSGRPRSRPSRRPATTSSVRSWWAASPSWRRSSGPGPGSPRRARPACCWSRARPASARPGSSTPSPTWPRAPAAACCVAAATRPNARCSSSRSSTPSARSCSTPLRRR